MKTYTRKVNYYETDQMGVVHHSNYFRYFEEARTFFMEEVGYTYAKLEETQIISPVVDINCQYKRSVLYGETIKVNVKLVNIGKVRCAFAYEIVNAENGELKATGRSEHCFLDKSGRVVSIQKANPEFYETFMNEVEE